MLKTIYPLLIPDDFHITPFHLGKIVAFPGYVHDTALPMRKFLKLGIRKAISKNEHIHIDANELAFIERGMVRKAVFINQIAERSIIIMGSNSLLGTGYILSNFIGLNMVENFWHIIGQDIQFISNLNSIIYIFNIKKLQMGNNQDLLQTLRSYIFYDYAIKSNQHMIMACILSMPSTYLKVAAYFYTIYNIHKEKIIDNPGFTLDAIASILGIHKSGFHKVLRKLEEEHILKSISKKKIEFENPERLLALIREEYIL